jgi:anionic cell wall polymer biosynthesis LytR-Cps2A-Psr (LCP) family protein
MLYSRIRSLDGDGDFSRTNRQRKVINSIIGGVKDSSLSEILALLNAVLPMVTTDMSNTEILGYALEIFPMLTEMEYDTMRIPVEGTFQQGNVQVREGVKNWFQYNIDFAANRKVLNEIFAE